ncbi:DUF2867 domain-containing protein [Motilimonas pumila]|uniref:DUF2867 domain-containing protein n=1 Tax=Motilimonas pumila TaxID=2303987 RepID=A0A418YAQ9_9GAMM|nr:DUF2867 domain-containing protein [Motilimonas pumila]RJG40049.1 DUF2867 domain-containing protein [Motilimonas pumila]
MKILVIGAFGTIGKALVPALVAAGHEVSVSSRRAKNPLPWPNLPVHRFTLDLLIPETISPALEGIELVYYLMHGMSDGQQYTKTEVQAAQFFVQCVNQSQVKQVIYMGSLISANPQSKHMQARVKTGEILASANMPVIELRAGIIITPGSAAFEVMRDLVGHLPVLFAPRSIHLSSPPIAIDNLVYYLTCLGQDTFSENQCFDALGPQWLSYVEMMQCIGKHLKRRCRVLALPYLPLSWSSAVLGIVTSVPKHLAKALIAGLDEAIIGNDKALRERYPQTLLTLDQAMEKVLAAETIKTYPQEWQDGVPEFRNFSPLHGFYAKSADIDISIPASTRSVWQVINLLGGKHRYFYLNMLWAMREWMDAAVGGEGRAHGRTNPDELVVGDKVDSWTILSVQPERLLVMKFGMKAPGGGGMQFRLKPNKDNTRTDMSLRLLWHPAGFWGLAYWYFFAPWHRLLLNGMTKAMAKLAMRFEQE